MNNKGFAITSVIYGLAILGVMIVAILMGTLSSSRHNVSEEAKAVEEFLINFNQTEITFRESSNYIVPQEETGWYRIQAFGKGTAKARGTFITGIVYLEEGWTVTINMTNQATEVSVRGTKVISAPAAQGTVPGGGFICYSKAVTGGYVNMTNYELKDKNESLVGNNAVDFSGNSCSKAYVNGHALTNSGIINNPLIDSLVLPGAYNGTSGKVTLQRLAEKDELTPKIPRKNHKFDKVTKISINKGTNNIPIKGIYYTFATGTTNRQITVSGSTGNVTSVSVGNRDIYEVFILFDKTYAKRNLAGWTVTLETNNGNYIVYDSRDTLGIPIGNEGLHLSSFQPDSYTRNVLDPSNNFPIHGNYFMIPINTENMAVSAVLNGADDGNQLMIEPITGESRQMWAIDMINAPGSTTSNFPGIPNRSGRKEYRIMELTRYKALNIYYDENYKMNFVSASETFNSLSRNEPQIWNIFPMKDTTFAIKTVVPSFTLTEKSGFLFAKTLGESNNNLNYVMIGMASAASQGNSDKNTLPTSIERFRLYSLDFSK